MVRAGDRVTFVDAHDPVPRRVVRASYDDATRTCRSILTAHRKDCNRTLARVIADQAQGLG